MVKMNKKRQLTQNRKPCQSQQKPRRRSKLKNIRNSLSNNRELNNQVNEPMHQRQPPPSNANTTEQPPVQAEGNNEQKETEKRETVSRNQVSESGETGPLTTQ
ncbi:Hypothetical_protein [Hexamita inflata]|uniref:Hypothetical_protein n=1 Tax=Hexamita inflata TaxID=28002 RepID=A0AA86R2T2_9EUKA|nr:Hypothetical protein HINF_LOCUS52792 [Hexamita inflata]